MADPLSLLRHFNVNKRDIIERDDNIIFGEVSWPKTVKTNYLMYRTGKGRGNEFYTLECLLFLLRNVHLSHPFYVREAAARKIPVVRLPDRKDLLAYLNGETASSANIDKSTPVEIPTQVKRRAVETSKFIAKKPRLEETQVQRVKQQLAARLDAPKETSVNVDIKSLSEAMSVEKIAEIKAKRLVIKRTTIKSEDKNQLGTGLKEVLDMDIDFTKLVLSHERPGRTRTTILLSTGKSFAKNVFAILDSIKAKEGGGHQPSEPKPVIITKENSVQTARQQIYNRYDQQRFVKKREETEDFKIDTMGTYHGMSLKSVTEGKQPKGRVVLSAKQNWNHSYPQPIELPIQQRLNSSVKPKKRTSKTPIIMIPSANTSLITMYNVRDILQDLRFVSTEEKKRSGEVLSSEVLLQRRKNDGLTVPFRVIDNPAKLAQNDWDRVVAVFVMGPAWQFKGWPWNGYPVEIFNQICAFHLKYEEMKLDLNIAKWNVSVIELSRTQRHADRAALMVFWEKLYKYMTSFKPHLRF